MTFRLLSKFLLLLLFVVLVVPNSMAETQDQQIKVTLRAIGHEFLLQIGDSTSRILPIEKIDGRYAVAFENEFSFEPDLLYFATFKVFEDSKIRESYIVETEKCGTNELVHSFKIGLGEEEEMMQCQLRKLPKDCHVFYFTLVENKEEIETNKSSISIYIFAFIFFIIGICLILYLKKRRKQPVASAERSDLVRVGQFQFDQKGMKLTLKAQLIELSSKETDLLFLLVSNENKTLKRAEILKVVWGDDGDYVGRTLDVFISKLRKKLEADPNLKIINIRGIGYRFVIN